MVDGETRDYMKKKMKWRKLALALALAVVLYAAEHEGTGGC